MSTNTPKTLPGRTAYEIGLAEGLTDAYPHLRHLVFSTTLENADPVIEVVRGRPLDRVRQLKASVGKDLWLVGGGTLAHSLLPEINRLVLKNPVHHRIGHSTVQWPLRTCQVPAS